MTAPDDITALIARAREIANKATPGEWAHDDNEMWACVTVERKHGQEVATVAATKRAQAAADAAFIAASRTLNSLTVERGPKGGAA